MEITRLNYPIRSKKKFKVIHNKEEYTCYLYPCGNCVVTGNGNTENFKDITDTNLGAEIIIACSNAI